MSEKNVTQEESILAANEDIHRADGFILISLTGNKSTVNACRSGLTVAQDEILLYRQYVEFKERLVELCMHKTDNNLEEAAELCTELERRFMRTHLLEMAKKLSSDA